MGKVLAWLKAHWAPALGVGLAVVLALWFIVFRKSASSSGPVKTVTIPSAASSGGASGGSDGGGPLQSLQAAVTSAVAAPASWFPNFTAWVNQANRPDLQGASQGALWGEYVKELQSSGEGVLGFLNFDQWVSQANRPDLQGASQGALWGEYVKEQISALKGPVTMPAAALGTPIPSGGLWRGRPLADLGTGGLGSGNSPSIAPGGPLKQLVPLPQSFSWPAAPNKGPV